MEPGNQATSGRIVVNRTSERDIKVRDLIVLVDGGSRETLKFQQSMELPLMPGEHTVKVTNNLFSKVVTFTVAESETVIFTAGNVADGCMTGLIVSIGIYGVMLERAE